MKGERLIEYLSGADILQRQFEEEQRLICELTGREDINSLNLLEEAGWDIASKVYRARFGSAPRVIGQIVARHTGIDLAARGIKKLLENNNTEDTQ